MPLAITGPRRATRGHPDAWRGPEQSEEGTTRNVARPERVGSVALGAALLTYALRRRDPGSVLSGLLGAFFLHRGATGHCSVYRALGVSTGSAEAVLDPRRGITGRAATVNARKAIKVEHEVVIDRPRAELYAFWRDFTNLPRFMEHLVSVTTRGGSESHWVAKAPAGTTVEWDATIVNEVPDSIIAWKTVGHPDVNNAGAVNFSDAVNGRGTVVRVTLDYEPPGGRAGAAVARLFGENPDQQVRDDLQRFKRVMEAGLPPARQRASEDSAFA